MKKEKKKKFYRKPKVNTFMQPEEFDKMLKNNNKGQGKKAFKPYSHAPTRNNSPLRIKESKKEKP